MGSALFMQKKLGRLNLIGLRLTKSGTLENQYAA